ncbi:hypothetical protein, conserved [Leishmania tarentolae]|uniref:Uncharacterized protein n=1 Tax=Leishmania tarentolae TaxID=5689 RepID=A0A640KCP8_LEITA|nr:hypothetical protein, conserved [Leishmania tarentolae]
MCAHRRLGRKNLPHAWMEVRRVSSCPWRCALTAGAASMTMPYVRCEGGYEGGTDRDHVHADLGDTHAGDGGDAKAMLAGTTATRDASGTGPRARALLCTLRHEGVTGTGGPSPPSATTWIVGAATDDTERRACRGQGESKNEVRRCTVADDWTHRDRTTAPLGVAQAAPWTCSGLLSLCSRDADVRLDGVEEVELCTVAPILPRTFAVEQLVQQAVPCAYAFASPTRRPSISEGPLAAERACGGVSSPPDVEPAQCCGAPDLRTPISGGRAAGLRTVADEHLTFVRAVNSARVTTALSTGSAVVAGERLIGEDGVRGARMVPPCVPVYMQATAVATHGGSDSPSWTATRSSTSSERDAHESAEEGKMGAPTVPAGVGIASELSSQVADLRNRMSVVGEESADEAQARRGSAAVSAGRWRSTELLAAAGERARTRPKASESAPPVSASSTGAALCVPTRGEASELRALYDDNAWARRERAARASDSPAPATLLTWALMEHVGSGAPEEHTVCSWLAAAQARYEQCRPLLWRCGNRAGSSRKGRMVECANTNSEGAQDDETRSGGKKVTIHGAPPPPPPRTAVTHGSMGAGGFEAADAFGSSAAVACFAPPSIPTDTATDLAISGMDATDADAGSADFSASITTLSGQRCNPRLSTPRRLPKEPRGQRQPARRQSLYASQPRQVGAAVEWSSGVVSCTADTLGLYEEQQARAQRLYYVLPPHPSSPHGGGGASNVASREDRSTLRGAVVAQLQRLGHLRRAEYAVAHGVAVAESGDKMSARVLADTRPADGAAPASLEVPLPVRGEPSVLPRNSPVSPTPTMPGAALPAHQCRCHRCLPLLVQFARVPSLASPVLRRYLDALHETALPGLPAQQGRHVAVAESATEVSGVSPPNGVRDAVAQPASSSVTETVAASGVEGGEAVAGRGSWRDPGHGGGSTQGPSRRPRYRSEDEMAAADGAKREGEREEKTVPMTTSLHSPESGGDAPRPGSAADLLKVFPALQQWRMRGREGGIATARALPNCKRRRMEPCGVALSLPDTIQQSCGGLLQPIARRTMSDSHDAESGAPGGAAPPTVPSEALSGGVDSLGWVDGAVLDEVAVIGVVPRGHPHQLQLVAPSRAFCLTLTQGLEEVAESAVQMLGFVTPPDSALPPRMPAGMSGAPEAAAATAGTSSSETTSEWRAWVEAEYFLSMWRTLRRCLTTAEWQTLLQEARGSPFLARWTAMAAAESGTESAAFREAGSPGIDLYMTSAIEVCVAGSPTAEQRKAVAGVHEALRDLRSSVSAAAEAHTAACVSAAEDIVTRVVLTALVPILHRRITVMYELLRHFASRSLYVSHRVQCDAYQHWYSRTPSPAAVLRLLQRSGRFSRALARCYPQYDLSPVMRPVATTQGDGEHGGLAAGTSASALSSPRPPLRWARGRAPSATAAHSVATGDSVRAASSTSKHKEYSRQLDGLSDTCAAACPLRRQARDEEKPLLPSSPSSRTTTASATDVTSAWVACLPSWSSEASREAPPERERKPVMAYVPEAALLDPRYLQRFAWRMHRVHHGTGANGSGIAVPLSTSGTGGTGAGAQPRPRGASTVSIPGDYLQAVPVHEQDASIRTVLRSMAQKGRTLDLREMSQHIRRRHASYVCR